MANNLSSDLLRQKFQSNLEDIQHRLDVSCLSAPSPGDGLWSKSAIRLRGQNLIVRSDGLRV